MSIDFINLNLDDPRNVVPSNLAIRVHMLVLKNKDEERTQDLCGKPGIGRKTTIYVSYYRPIIIKEENFKAKLGQSNS